MAEPFLAEIRLFSFNFAPEGWAFCNGQTLSISQNTALFSLIGTFYGGNGTTTFVLPNLQGAVAVSQGTDPFGNPYAIGQFGGEAEQELSLSEIPGHSHSFAIGASGTLTTPVGNTFGVPDVNPRLQNLYTTTQNASANLTSILNAGSSQAHNNLQPYLVVNFCIALTGIYPSRN